MEKHLFRMVPAIISRLTCINAGNAVWTVIGRTKSKGTLLSFVDSFTLEGKKNFDSIETLIFFKRE